MLSTGITRLHVKCVCKGLQKVSRTAVSQHQNISTAVPARRPSLRQRHLALKEIFFYVIHQQIYGHTSQAIAKTCQHNCCQVVSNHSRLACRAFVRRTSMWGQLVLYVPGDATHWRKRYGREVCVYVRMYL